MKVNEKDQDFAIYREVSLRADKEEKLVKVPIVSIECKTYIDKTMLEGSIATAEKIKNGNPYSLFLVVAEYYDVSFDVAPAYFRIDQNQIYVLRKQRRSERKVKKPIHFDVINSLFSFVKKVERWHQVCQTNHKRGRITRY